MDHRIRLNVDAAELDDEPAELYALAHVVNVACGAHAGDERLAARAIRAASAAGGAVAAHPSYPDRAGFGRARVAMAPEALEASIHAQCMFILGVAAPLEVAVRALKPHGALYHDATAEPEVARAIARVARGALGPSAVLVGAPRGALAAAAAELGLGFAREAFADRGVTATGALVPRGAPGALVTDPAAVRARTRELCARGDVDTICVHGDSPGAVDLARAAREEIDRWASSRA